MPEVIERSPGEGAQTAGPVAATSTGRVVRLLAGAAIAGGTLAAAAVLSLDATIGDTPLRGRPMRLETISEYVYSPGSGLFIAAVLLLALGSVGLTLALIRLRVIRHISPTATLLYLWVIGLAGIIIFPKHNWDIGPSTSGWLHQAASLAAFLALPMAVLLIARQHRRRESWAAKAAWVCALGGLGFLSVLFAAIAAAAVTNSNWWQLIPLGFVERGIAGFEVAAVIALSCWAIGSAKAQR